MTSARLDIYHAVGLLSKYNSNPDKEHWQAVKYILRYQDTIYLKLYFEIGDLELIGYSNIDFESNLDNIKSISRQIYLFGGTTVFWLSKKQDYY